MRDGDGEPILAIGRSRQGRGCSRRLPNSVSFKYDGFLPIPGHDEGMIRLRLFQGDLHKKNVMFLIPDQEFASRFIAGQVEGVIGIRFTQKRSFRAEEMDLAQALAAQSSTLTPERGTGLP